MDVLLRLAFLALSMSIAACGTARARSADDDDDIVADGDADTDSDSDADSDADSDTDSDSDSDIDVDGDIDGDADGDADGELCNGLDDDGDLDVDEGNPGGGVLCNSDLVGRCALGETACEAGEIVCVPDTEPRPETCANGGVDDDCNGVQDDVREVGLDCDSGQPGACSAGIFACEGAAQVCIAQVVAEVEACDTGIDEDCDGEVDELGCEAGVCGGWNPPDVGLEGADGAVMGTWHVCRADCDSAWVSSVGANGGTYDMDQVCQFLGYRTWDLEGGTCGDLCGFCGEARENYDGSNGCTAPQACSTVNWRCIP